MNKECTDGDCFEAAAHIITTRADENGPLADRANPRLCHGVVTATDGPHQGNKYVHAWVEFQIEFAPNKVICFCADYSNGRETELPQEFYYQLGDIDASSVKRYDPLETARRLLVEGHYGPWDFDSTEYENEVKGEQNK